MKLYSETILLLYKNKLKFSGSFLEKYQNMQGFSSDNIIVHQAEHQGYSILKEKLNFGDHEYKYTEDTGTIFEIIHNGSILIVSSVCDGHAGYMTSFYVTSIMEKMFLASIAEAGDDISAALTILFAKIAAEIKKMRFLMGGSGATCNVTVFDKTNARVYIASLGDSPTIRYRKNDQNLYFMDWRSTDQDCSDPEEIDRMIQIHIKNGDINATRSSVVYEDESAGKKSGIYRNTRSQMMLHSSFGDFPRDYYPGVVNTVPRIYSHDWLSEDVYIQCSDGLLEWLANNLTSIQPRSEFRVEEIASHLDTCINDENIASRLHELQITSMVTTKVEAHPTRPDSSYNWVEKNFDNHITKVFMAV